MKKARQILVIGGNRFFGKRLIEKLLAQGDLVTVLNRGQLEDGFGERVTRITCDRNDTEKLKKSVQHNTWDLVYDQVCFDGHQSKAACEIFSELTKKYVFTSTQSVYNYGENLSESVYSPKNHKYDKTVLGSENYGEAKRQSEAVFFSQNKMPVIAVRFPMVVGPDDYTKRLKFYVDKINNGESVYFPNLEVRMSLIHSDDAAEGLLFLGNCEFTGSINLASSEPLRIKDLIQSIENTVGKKAEVRTSPESPDEKSPYGLPEDWFMNINLANSLGFTAKPISQWLPEVIKSYL